MTRGVYPFPPQCLFEFVRAFQSRPFLYRFDPCSRESECMQSYSDSYLASSLSRTGPLPSQRISTSPPSKLNHTQAHSQQLVQSHLFY